VDKTRPYLHGWHREPDPLANRNANRGQIAIRSSSLSVLGRNPFGSIPVLGRVRDAGHRNVGRDLKAREAKCARRNNDVWRQHRAELRHEAAERLVGIHALRLQIHPGNKAIGIPVDPAAFTCRLRTQVQQSQIVASGVGRAKDTKQKQRCHRDASPYTRGRAQNVMPRREKRAVQKH